jgi:hypothetical protein
MSKTPGKKTIGSIVGLALVLTIPAASAFSAPSCPEVDSARAMLTRAAATQNDRERQAPRGQETQASRSQDIQAPRGQGQDIQAPRQGQDVQAPRNQDIQSPRSGTTASGSGQATVPSHMTRAAALVKEADTACQAGKTAEASQKAKAAIVLMQQ